MVRILSEDLSSCVLTHDAISDVSQYGFNIQDLSVTPKHVKPPNNKRYSLLISGLENISTPFKVVNIAEDKKIIYIGYIASRQNNNKSQQLSLGKKPKFPQTDPQKPSPPNSLS